jgi:hypothetical protein
MYINKQSNIQKKDLVSTKTVSGNPVVISDCAGGKARSLKTTIEAIQDLHGYDHPWAGGADVNKFDISSATMAGLISVFGLTVAKDSDGYITITGTYIGESSVPKFAIIPTLPLLDNAVFYLMDKNTDANNNVIQCRWSNPSTGGVAIDLQNMVQNQTYNIKFRLMIVTDGTTPTAFRPYSNECPISGRTEARVDTENEDSTESAYAVIQLGQTVYGADINWDTGVCTIDHAIVDLGTCRWTAQTTNTTGIYRMNTDDLKSVIDYPDTFTVLGDISCEWYGNKTARETYQCKVGIAVDNTGGIFIYDENYTTGTSPTAFTSFISGCHLCYKLKTPTTLQLTPAQLEMLKGYNRVSIDNGTITLDYIPDNLAGDIISLVEEELEEINTNIGLGETVSADMANCLPPRFKDISNDFFNGNLKAEIAAGNFRNVRPGDYIIGSSTGSKYVVGACDYWYNKGDTACTTHHLRLMLVEVKNISQLWAGLPYDGGTGHWTGLNRCPWNAAVNVDPTSASAVGSNNTNISRTITISGTGTASPTTASASGYAGSFIRDRLIARLLPDCFVADFGSANVLLCRNLNGNAVTTDKPSAAMSNWNGMTSGWTWMDSQIELPSEVELYGTMVFSSSAMDVGCQDQQLALFRNVSIEQVVGRTDVWTKAVASSTIACFRCLNGIPNLGHASRALCALPLANVK